MVDEKQIQHDFDMELDKALDKANSEDLVVEDNTSINLVKEGQEKFKNHADMVDVEIEDFSDELSGVVQLEEEDKNKVFTIVKAFRKDPIYKNSDGQLIEPKISGDKKYYQSKLEIDYETDKRYVSLIPNIKWYVRMDNGKMKLSPWFATKIKEEDLDNMFTPTICKLYYKYCVFKGLKPGVVTQKEFIDGLVGMKARLKTTKQQNPVTKEIGYRIDIVEFVE